MIDFALYVLLAVSTGTYNGGTATPVAYIEREADCWAAAKVAKSNAEQRGLRSTEFICAPAGAPKGKQ